MSKRNLCTHLCCCITTQHEITADCPRMATVDMPCIQNCNEDYSYISHRIFKDPKESKLIITCTECCWATKTPYLNGVCEMCEDHTTFGKWLKDEWVCLQCYSQKPSK